LAGLALFAGLLALLALLTGLLALLTTALAGLRWLLCWIAVGGLTACELPVLGLGIGLAVGLTAAGARLAAALARSAILRQLAITGLGAD
jgi:hypothetical protein